MSGERIHHHPETLEEYIETTPFLHRAYKTAKEAHAGQKRADGKEYITHPTAVARIFYEEWGITDPERLAAAYLHDTVEDTYIANEDLRRDFGPKVAGWVEGVTNFQSDNRELADEKTKEKVLKKSFLDLNVALFKLADRLHNMRTMNSMKPEKQVAKSIETLNVYAPLAESLGMWKVKTELENLSLKYIDPESYTIFYEEMAKDERTSEQFTINMVSGIEQILRSCDVEAEVTTRLNSLVRLKNKRERTFLKEISDMISFRVIVNEKGEKARKSAYGLMGELRNKFKGVEDLSRYSDAYFDPRPNGYSAMHMILNTHAGAVEIAITSKEKEDFNDWGILSLIRNGYEELTDYSLKLVFTPTGKAKILRPGATGVDFAYSITDDFGNRAESILINGVVMPITTVIPHGATVKVNIGKDSGEPKPGIENYAGPAAKKRIEIQRKLGLRKESEKKGEEMVKKVIEEIGILDLADLFELGDEMETSLTNFLYNLGCKGSLNDLYYQIGTGRMKMEYFRGELESRGFTKDDLNLSSILIEGKDEPGLLQLFSAKVAELGGKKNIIVNKGVGQGHFSQRFVVKLLSEEEKQKLTEAFEKDDRILKIKII